MKIQTNKLINLIKESIKEQSQSYFDHIKTTGEKSDDSIMDKMDTRHRSHYDDGKNEYIPVNPKNTHARNIFKYSTPETVNDVVKNCKKEKSISDLQHSNGEDREFLGWDTFTSDETGEPMGVNASKMRKAKMYYDIKGMSPEEKQEYIKKNFPGRYTTVNGLAKESCMKTPIMKITETQLRTIIKNILKEETLYEFDPNEWDEEYDDERPEVLSHAEFYFDPQTLEILINTEDNENTGYIKIVSNDFPNAWERYISGDYLTPPTDEGETGECGGDYKVESSWVPEEFENKKEEIINNFLNIHHEEIVAELTDNAEFN